MPTTNPFFSTTTGYEGEVNLLDDLVIEQIGMFGIDVVYLPKRMINYDRFLNESTKDIFEMALPMPVYIKNYSGYNSGMEILTKFGVKNSEEMTLVMSKSQYTAHYAPFMKAYYQNMTENDTIDLNLNEMEGKTEFRPKEGDLIYFPLDDGIFEIKYVLFDEPFFQLGKGYTFELQCEKFEYSGEVFDTDIPELDKQQTLTSYYRLEFDVLDGRGTFLHDEGVSIYRINDDFELKEFELGALNSLFYNVTVVNGKVMKWNKPKKKLVIGNITNEDPTQVNKTTGNVDADKLERVLILGQVSGAVYVSSNAEVEDTAFDDELQIQKEFDRIKVVDEKDLYEFGFY
jgi:hypothetical protein